MTSRSTTLNIADFDKQMMGGALHMASRGLGRAWPNPSVGAVIANPETGELISRGVTADGGRPHAETAAIKVAGERAKGASIYVTLEPCSHHGQTGPCADAIIAAGLTRAIVAIEDPDPRVAGRGLDRLRAAGLEVIRGVGADQARYLTRGHIVRVTERRPFVTLKLALDADGNIEHGTGGAPRWVTSEVARAHGQLLRATSDAILVGAGTIRDDDPQLTCRLPGLEARSPVRVIVAGEAPLPAESKLFKTAKQTPVWVAGSKQEALAGLAGVELFGVEMIDTYKVGGRLWLPSLMEALVARGITRLLVEGGPAMWRAFADASLADEVVVFLAGSGVPKTHEVLAIARRWLGPLPLAFADMRRLGGDTMWRFSRTISKEG